MPILQEKYLNIFQIHAKQSLIGEIYKLYYDLKKDLFKNKFMQITNSI